MFMLVNKRPYISCANEVEMWVLKEKRVRLYNPILSQLRWNKEKYN